MCGSLLLILLLQAILLSAPGRTGQLLEAQNLPVENTVCRLSLEMLHFQLCLPHCLIFGLASAF